MLAEAEIEILDESGHIEERVRIVGCGEVAVATADTPRLHYLPNAPADIDAVIRIRDGAVIIEPRKHQALRVDSGFLPMAEPFAAPRTFTATLAAVSRRLSVRTLEVPNASVMCGELVIREHLSEIVRSHPGSKSDGERP